MLLSILGKVIISLAYAAVYLHASEIFPTEIRSVGLGTAATIESVGATLAPTVGGLLVLEIVLSFRIARTHVSKKQKSIDFHIVPNLRLFFIHM